MEVTIDMEVKSRIQSLALLSIFPTSFFIVFANYYTVRQKKYLFVPNYFLHVIFGFCGCQMVGK